MSLHTPIEWCDSTDNPVMGCDGCELWQPEKDIKICYAGVLHDMRGGKVAGYASEFLVPEMFPGRMAAAAKWRDLRGKARPDKPWLDGRPRQTFISDMGDALSASVPFEYLRTEVIDTVAGQAWSSRGHLGLWLTKQPQRMAALDEWLAAQGIPWPVALWAGTSITGPGQGARVRHIRRVRAAVRFLSIEPVLKDPGELDLEGIALVIIGGQSGNGSGLTDLVALRALIARARAAGCKVFVKQLGAYPKPESRPGEVSTDMVGRRVAFWRRGLEERLVLKLADRKGGDWSEWPEDLRIREMPEVRDA